MDLAAEWLDRLRAEADGYARLALENIAREFPTLVSALMTAPGQFPPRPRDRTPVFYGSFDWHSCVEMHWVLVRLLRLPGRGTRGRDQGRARHPVHPGRPAPGGRVRRDERNRLAALRLGLGAHPDPRAGGLARRRGRPALDRGHGAAGRRVDGELPGLAAQGHLSDPDRRCTPTARSRCPGHCRTRGCGPKTVGPNWPGPSRRPGTAGTPPTRTIPAAGSRQAATSCHPR